MKNYARYFRISGTYEYRNGRTNFGTIVGADDISDAISYVASAVGRRVRIDNVQHLGNGLEKTLDEIAGIEKRYGKASPSGEGE